MVKKKSVKTELDRYLKALDRKELEAEVKKLYTKFSDVKKYYELEFSQDTTAVLNEFKAKLRKEYFPSRGFGKARNRESRKVITDFKKISIFTKDVIELLLYRVEMMIEFTKAYGDIDEPFYNSLDSSFDEACKLMAKEKLEPYFKSDCLRLIKESDDFGWGLYETLSDSYNSYMKEKKE